MTWRCRSTLSDLAFEGYTSGAKRALSGGKGVFPHRLPFTRADLDLARGVAPHRMSISGVQDKVQLKLVRGALEPVQAGGDFLLKPIPSAPLHRAECVPANEHLCMQIARQVFRVETPANALVILSDEEPAYLVRRYDRQAATPDGRLHQEDLGQVMARSTEDRNWKYQGSYEEMSDGIRLGCPAWKVALEGLWRRIVLCYALGNGDAHWKNFSLLEDPHGGYRLAPAYDLLSTSLHFPDESPLALDLFRAGELTASFEALGFWTGADFLELARRWELVPTRCSKWLAGVGVSTPAVLDRIGRSFLPEDLQARLGALWKERARALGMGSVGPA
jgi:serine/threonine-protein kinase HipA